MEKRSNHKELKVLVEAYKRLAELKLRSNHKELKAHSASQLTHSLLNHHEAIIKN